jgi:hypothetical protein
MTDIWGPMFFRSACNTLKASRWQLCKARLFGQKHVGSDGEHEAIGYYYKGTFYLWDYRSPQACVEEEK